MPYHLLVVDDEERIRQIIRKYAEFEGHTVTEAADGMEAVELCRKQTFDLIVMDVMMPEMDGLEATKAIRQSKRKDHNILIYALSANAFIENENESLEAGMNGYLAKPIDNQKLKEVLLKIYKQT